MPRQPKLRDPMPDGQGTRGDRIVFYVRSGAFLAIAAQAAGISEATLYRWLQDERPMFREFREALERARAEAEVNAVLSIQAAARGGQSRKRQAVHVVEGQVQVVDLLEEAEPEWKAAAWLLERGFPVRWGRRQAVEVTGRDGGAIVVRDEEASRLAGGFEQWLSERGLEPPAIEPPRPAEDVVDAEVVDDDEAGSPAGGDGGA